MLRIEDTDVERSGTDMVEAILQSMRWLGLDWDEEVVRQSDRLDIYSKHIDELIDGGHAYKCFCTKEELDRRREATNDKKQDYKYRHDRTCLKRDTDQIASLEREGRPFVVRLKLPMGVTSFHDEIYGDIKVDHRQLDDFILLRSDGYPTYHFAVVVDDHEMNITHVLRGEDHVSNTPKHILIYQAFGWQLPVYAHLPMILGPDKKRLSKRHGATSVGEYERAGYLPETMLNFLSLLGWSSGDDRELFNRSELVQHFSLDGIAKKSAVFDDKKLEWMNGQYIMQLSDQELLQLTLPYLKSSALLDDEFVARNRPYLDRVVALLKHRLKRIGDVVAMSGYFFQDPGEFEEKAVRKYWQDSEICAKLALLSTRLQELTEFDGEHIESVMRTLAEELETSAGKLIHPARLALTGVSFSPSMFEVMELLGKETVLRRLQAAMEYVKANRVTQETPGS